MINSKILSTKIMVLALLATGCSVRGGRVASAPPDIGPRLQSLEFGVEFGQFQADKFSMVMWPNEWTPAQRQVKTTWIKIGSNQAIQDMAFLSSAPRTLELKFAAFQEAGCIEKYRLPENVNDCEPSSCTESYEVVWKTLTPVGDADPAYAEYQKQKKELEQCVGNQGSRREVGKILNQLMSTNKEDFITLNEPEDLKSWPSEKNKNAKPAPTAQIEQVVGRYLFDDDLYPSGSNPITDEERRERSVSLKEKKTLIYIYPSEKAGLSIMISLLGVRDAKTCRTDADSGEKTCKIMTQSNDPQIMKAGNYNELNESAMIKDVVWDQKNRKLNFTLPDASSQFNAVANKFEREYRFKLERVVNVMTRYSLEPVTDYAKFTGDIDLVKDGQIIRKGAAQILGAIREFPAQEKQPANPDAPASDLGSGKITE